MSEEENPEERRHYPRYDVDYDITIGLSDGGQTTARAKDVSLGGLCVKGLPTWQADVGDVVQMSITIPEFFITVSLQGEILWRDPDTKRVGVKFGVSEGELAERIGRLNTLLGESITPIK